MLLAQDTALIKNYFPDLTAAQIAQFDALADLYLDWNSKINLISRKDIQHLYERHILHSLSIAKVVSFQPGATILDLGTGGGFPGIPLAILFPQSNFLLVDSIQKKIKVVQDIIEQLGLSNVSAEAIRAEQLAHCFDFVVARAVTAPMQLYNWVKDKINPKGRHPIANGILYLQGGDALRVPSNSGLAAKAYAIASFFPLPFFATKQILHLYPKSSSAKAH